MAVRQITIRLPPDVKKAFEKYAEAVGLDASELARLLVVRERHRKRLFQLFRNGQIPSKPKWQRGTEKLTVTAHMPSVDEVKAFDRYARRCGLNHRNDAGVWLLEAELQERWLEKAIRST